MKKKILCLAMIAIMALGIPMNANAEVFYGEDDWKVTYEKGALSSNFKGSKASEDVLTKLLPGDTMHLQIKLENKSGKISDWYMANEVLQSLEGDRTDLGGAYTYILTYTDSKGTEETIYSNERVGGELPETRVAAEIGLEQATNSLEKHFYLDRLEKGETGIVKLTVKLDGETQGNDYQKTLASLQMDFAVEEVSEVTHTKVEKVEKPIIKEVVQRQIVTTSVKTGDASHIALYSAVALAAGVLLLVIVVKNRKKEEQ